jgi:DNA-binding transcriptional LysR family regulator
MHIEQLKYIVEVAKAESIAVASEKLYVSQSAISQSITSLEEELGIKIFTRSRHGTKPTNEGKKIIQKAFEVLNKLQEMKDEAQTHALSISGELKLSVVPGSMPFILTILQGFKNQYPNIHIEIKEQGCHEIIVDLNQDKTDIGLTTIYEGLLKHADKHEFEVLLEGNTKVYVRKDSPLAFKEAITPQELQNHPIVFYNTGYAKWFFDHLCEKYGPMKLLFVSSSTDAVRKAILAGVAVSFIPEFCMMDDPDVVNGEMVPIRIQNYDAAKISFGLVRPKDRPLSVCTSKFIEYLNAEMKKENQPISLIPQ